jgi:hypothetical protein
MPWCEVHPVVGHAMLDDDRLGHRGHDRTGRHDGCHDGLLDGSGRNDRRHDGWLDRTDRPGEVSSELLDGPE